MTFNHPFGQPASELEEVQHQDVSRLTLYYGAGELSLAIHILLNEVGADFELVAVDPHAQRTEDGLDYRAINPSGRVPTLVTPTGGVLTGLAPIVQYVSDRAAGAPLMPAFGDARRPAALTWMVFLEAMQRQFALLFEREHPPADARDLTAGLCAQLDVVGRALQSSPYLLGSRFMAPDALLFVISGWMRFVGLPLNRWPALVEFSRRVARRPSVTKAFSREGLPQLAP